MKNWHTHLEFTYASATILTFLLCGVLTKKFASCNSFTLVKYEVMLPKPRRGKTKLSVVKTDSDRNWNAQLKTKIVDSTNGTRVCGRRNTQLHQAS